TSGDSVPSTQHSALILSSGTTAGQYGLIISSGGNFLVYGAVKTPWTTLSSPGQVGPGAAGTFTVGDTTGWQVGDTITIDTEAVTIATLPGSNQVTISQTLGYAHYSTNTVLVNMITHNVVVRSSGTDTNSNTAYIQNLATNATSFALTYGEFAYLGANSALSKFGITFDGSASHGSISSSTIRNGY